MDNNNGFEPQGGNIVGADNQVYNIVDLLGGGTPVNENIYDITMFKPLSSLIIGSDNRLYDLVKLINQAIPSVSVSAVEGGHQFTITDSNGENTFTVLDGKVGPKGDTGETGATGPQGPKGPKGDTGDIGATGPQGPKGDTGDIGALTINGKKPDGSGAVTLTAEDVGARPDSWTPTAAEVGAYPVSGVRALSISIAAAAWSGSGPYTATITESSVTEKTDCRFELGATLDVLAADISWETGAGTVTLTTASVPTGTIAGTLILMEVF